MLCPWLFLLWASFASLTSLFAVAVDHAVTSNHLRVSIRNDLLQDAPSCQHRIAQVELLNLHPTDHISISSIRTTKEYTETPGDNDLLSGEGDMQSDDPTVSTSSELPQQLHVSKLPGGSLELGPGQHAIVPVAFLPRFPTLLLEQNPLGETLDAEKDKFASRFASSSFQEADWRDLVDDGAAGGESSGTRRLRSNLHSSASPSPNPTDHEQQPRYHVSTTILVETNRGNLELPVDATSLRENSFGIPDIIYFDMSEEPGGSHQPETYSPPQFDEPVLEKDRLIEAARTLDGGKTSTIAREAGSTTAAAGGSPQLVGVTDAYSSAAVSGSYTNEGGATVPLPPELFSRNGATSKRRAWIVDRVHPPQQRLLNGSSSAAAAACQSGVDDATVKMQSQDCYDVYMSNPTAGFLQVTEVLLSRPNEHMTLYVVPEHGRAIPEGRHVIDNWKSVDPIGSVFGEEVEGAFTIPADERKHYVVTVCFTGDDHAESEYVSIESDVDDWFDSGDESKTLGFLQIKTTIDTLFIGLERADESMPKRTSATPSAADPPMESRRQQRNTLASANDAKRDRGLSGADGASLGCDAGDDACRSAYSDKSGDDDDDAYKESFLRTEPSTLEFLFLSSARQTVDHPIQIVNSSPQPVKIIRASVALEDLDGVTKEQNQTELLADLGIRVQLVRVSKALVNSIASFEKVDKAMTVKCTVDWERFKSSAIPSVDFRGALVLRGTTQVDWSFSDWERAVKAGMMRDDWNFVFEVPFTIAVRSGRVDFLVQGTTHAVPSFWSMEEYNELLDVPSCAFFPFEPSYTMATLGESQKERMSPSYGKGVDHQLRVFSTLDMDIVVDSVVVTGGNSDQTPLPALCDRFDAYIVERGPSDHIDLADLANLGLIVVRYRYPGSAALTKEKASGAHNRSNTIFPTTCFLRVKTEPDSGMHEIPFVIYSGNLDVSGGQSQANFDDGALNTTLTESESWYEAVLGFDSLLDWFRNSKGGFALRSVLKASSERGSDTAILGRYLFGLAKQTMGVDISKLNPVLLKAGAIGEGESETLPLYLTNYNPVPISVSIDVGEVEGLSIALGRDESSEKGDGNSIFDHLPHLPDETELLEPQVESGRYMGHPLNGLRQFLLTNDLAKEYLHRFPFRDDITMSYPAISRLPLLRKLFRSYALGQFHKAPKPLRFTSAGWNRCDKSIHPPRYGPFAKKFDKNPLGPIIISNDRRSVRRLAVCWEAEGEPVDQKSDGTVVVIPPGGVARFDVTLRSPESAALDKDITQFLATGLMLSTDHGELIPVLVSLDALQGKLEVSPVPSLQQHDANDGSIQVEAGIFEVPSTSSDSSVRVPPHIARSFADFTSGETIVPRNASSGEGGVSLFMKSSFLRDVHLREIVSCNPWFEVELADQTANLDAEQDPFLGINIGSVRSIVACNAIDGVPSNTTVFSSFFRCVLNWMAMRTELQPRGCGWSGREYRKDFKDIIQTGERGETGATVRALKRALLVSEWSDADVATDQLGNGTMDRYPVKTGRRGDGVVAPATINAVSAAWNVLQVALDAGLLSLGTSLRAVVEYNATPAEVSPVKYGSSSFEEPTHLLSVAIRNVTVQTALKIPRLLVSDLTHPELVDAHVVDFPPTLVANVASVMLPLRNPTAVPVRIRLAVASAVESRIDDSIRARYLGKCEPPFVQSRRTSSAYTSHHWWDRGGAFFHHDFHGDMIRSHYNITLTSGFGSGTSLMNPSYFATTAFVVGCGARCGLRNDAASKSKKGTVEIESSLASLLPTSPIGASAASGKTLVGRQRSSTSQANLFGDDEISMPAGGALTVGGKGPAAFGLPYSVLDEIVIPPFSEAEIGPILFRPPGRTQVMGCASMQGSNKLEMCTTQTFESMVFLENSLTGLESVVLRGKALWEKVIFLDPGADDFGDIELRHGRSTLVFPWQADYSTDVPRPTLKEVLVHNDGDVPVTVNGGYLSRKPNERKNLNVKLQRTCELSHFRLLGCPETPSGIFPFFLAPGQNRSIFIDHRPKCSKKKEYISLILELDRYTKSTSSPTVGHLPFSNPSKFRRKVRAHEQGILLRKSKIELQVGYEMTDENFASCLPLPNHAGEFDEREVFGFAASDHSHQNKDWSKLGTSLTPAHYFRTGFNVICMLVSLTALALWLMSFRQRLGFLLHAAKSFNEFLNCPKSKPAAAESDPSLVVGSNWSAAFRCLARADPTSSDLQSLGREQTRQVVLARFKSIGARPSHRSHATGATSRERQSIPTAPGRQLSAVAGSRSSSNNDRIRLSDAIFGRFNPRLVVESGLLPSQLGWQVAASRGIIDASSLKESRLQSKVDELLSRRRNPPSSVGRDSIHVSESGSESDSASDLSSSFDGNLSDNGNTMPTSNNKSVAVEEVETLAPLPSDDIEVAENSHITRTSYRNDASGREEAPKLASTTAVSSQLVSKDPSPADNLASAADGALPYEKTTKISADDLKQKISATKKPKKVVKDKTKDKTPPPVDPDRKQVLQSSVGGSGKQEVSKSSNSDAKGKAAATRTKARKQQTSSKIDKAGEAVSSDDERKQNRKQNRSKKKRSNTEKKSPSKAPSSPTVTIPPSPKSYPDSPSSLRPPPGLLPPPGFGGAPNSPPRSPLISNAATHVNSRRNDEIFVPPAPPSTGNSSLANFSLPDIVTSHQPDASPLMIGDPLLGAVQSGTGTTTLSGGLLETGHPSPQPSPKIAFQNSMSDFDVMDFLDGIIGEGGADDTGGLGTEQASPRLLPVNPWAAETSEGYAASRAAAYGISFEESSERTLDSANIPLLTPAALLSPRQEQDEDKNFSSFYSNLMNE